MTELTVRKLLIDLTTPFAMRWNGGEESEHRSSAYQLLLSKDGMFRGNNSARQFIPVGPSA
jgi:predicted metal-dependent hydrolase